MTGSFERRAEAKLLSFAGQGVPTKLGNIQETILLNPVNLSAKTKDKFFTIRCVSCSRYPTHKRKSEND